MPALVRRGDGVAVRPIEPHRAHGDELGVLDHGGGQGRQPVLLTDRL